MVAQALPISDWSTHRTSLRFDLMGLAFAIALHAPIFFMKWEPRKKAIDHPADRLVAVDLMDEAQLKKQLEAPAPPPPPPAPKESGMMAKLRALVAKAPPPPEPKKEIEKKVDLGPKAIDLKPNLAMPEKPASTLVSKSGFQTAADPKLVQQKQLAMNAGGPALAPLSAQKLGTIENRQSLKSDKGKFQINQGETLSGIGGGPKIADPSAPAIAIRTGAAGTKEAFTAPPPPKADKGKFGAGAASGLGSGPAMGLRDSIIARDAKPGQIAMAPTGGGLGGIGGGAMATKRDAGRFSGGGVEGGVVGGVPGGRGSTLGGTGTGIRSVPTATSALPHKKSSPSMFTIQGPLKDRKIERQVAPEYPAWAQAQGIEASVVLEFTVQADGLVKNVVIVRQTSGYPKLDESAIKALHQWKFVALPEGENREEVGLITFRYSLS